MPEDKKPVHYNLLEDLRNAEHTFNRLSSISGTIDMDRHECRSMRDLLSRAIQVIEKIEEQK